MAIGLKKSVPLLPSRSTPTPCCALTVVVRASASRPSPSRPAARSLFWKRSSPATAPPPRVFSSSATVTAPREIVSTLLPLAAPCRPMAAVPVPSTSAWLPTKMFRLPSSASTVVACT